MGEGCIASDSTHPHGACLASLSFQSSGQNSLRAKGAKPAAANNEAAPALNSRVGQMALSIVRGRDADERWLPISVDTTARNLSLGDCFPKPAVRHYMVRVLRASLQPRCRPRVFSGRRPGWTYSSGDGKRFWKADLSRSSSSRVQSLASSALER